MHPEKLIPYAKKNNKRKDKVMDDELIMIEFSDISNNPDMLYKNYWIRGDY